MYHDATVCPKCGGTIHPKVEGGIRDPHVKEWVCVRCGWTMSLEMDFEPKEGYCD